MKILNTLGKIMETTLKEAAKDVTVSELDRLQEALFEQYTIYQKAKAKASDEYKVYAEIENKLINKLEGAGKEKYQSPAGTFWYRYESSFKVPKETEDREKFFAHLKEKDVFDSMITVNSKTLNSWAKKEEEIAEEAGELDFNIPGIEKGAPSPKGYRRRSK